MRAVRLVTKTGGLLQPQLNENIYCLFSNAMNVQLVEMLTCIPTFDDNPGQTSHRICWKK